VQDVELAVDAWYRPSPCPVTKTVYLEWLTHEGQFIGEQGVEPA